LNNKSVRCSYYSFLYERTCSSHRNITFRIIVKRTSVCLCIFYFFAKCSVSWTSVFIVWCIITAPYCNTNRCFTCLSEIFFWKKITINIVCFEYTSKIAPFWIIFFLCSVMGNCIIWNPLSVHRLPFHFVFL